MRSRSLTLTIVLVVALLSVPELGSAAVDVTITNTELAAAGDIRMLDDGRMVLVVPEERQGLDLNGDGDTADELVHGFNVATATSVNLGLNHTHGTSLHAFGDRVAFLVDEAAQGEDLNSDGDTDDDVAHVYRPSSGEVTNLRLALTGTAGLRPVGSNLAVPVNEQHQGEDLNGDGDTGDAVMHFYIPGEARTVNLRLAHSGHTRAAGSRLMFTASEAGQGRDFNGDGDQGDRVLMAYDPGTGATSNLGLAYGVALTTSEHLVALAVSEEDQGGVSLNGDPDTDDNVVHVYDTTTGTTTNLGLAYRGSMRAAGAWVAFGVYEGGRGVPLNGDADIADNVLHVYQAGSGDVTNVGLAMSGELKVFGDRMAFTVSEDGEGRVLNGDTDIADSVVHIYAPQSATLVNLELAWQGGEATLAASDEWLAFIASEAGQGVDINGDGDEGDGILYIVSAAGLEVTNSGLAASRSVAVEGSWVGFRVSEEDQRINLNGDEDLADLVAHVYDAPSRTAFNLQLATRSTPRPIGRYFAMRVDEGAQSEVRNGDGDQADNVAAIGVLNTSPVAIEDIITVAEGGTVTGNVLSNDTDAEGDALIATTPTDPAHGTVVVAADGAYTYVHDGSETTADSFTYRANDGAFDSGVATVSITVTPVNDAPVATDDGPFTVTQGATLSVPNGSTDLLANDTDAEGGPLTALGVTDPTYGTLTLDTDGSFTYVHDGSSATADSFTYTAHDGAATSNVATVSLSVTPAGHTVGLVDPAQGRWHLRNTAGAVTTFFYGNPGDVPFMGDWDCDGDATPGLFRTSDAYAYLRNSNSQGIADIRFFFGNPSDIPLAGDWNGDGCDTVSIYRPSEQRFYIINELGQNEGGLGSADFSFLFGNPGDNPVVGDWDGDGISEVGLHRESTGFFYWRTTLDTGVASGEIFFGDPADRCVAGDWGIIDGADTPAVFRPNGTTFFFRHTLTQGIADSQVVLGESGFLPVAGAFGLG